MFIFNSSIISSIRHQIVVRLVIATLAIASPAAKATTQLDLAVVNLFETPSVKSLESNASTLMQNYSSARLPNLFSHAKPNSSWVTSIRLNLAKSNIQRAQLSPKLRFESKGQHIEITARSNSISMFWHKAL